MTPRPDGRPTFEELQAARRREVAARRREITKAPRPAAPRPLRLRLSDEPVEDPAPPRKGDAEALRRAAAVRAALTPAERELLDAVQDTLRRRADLRLRPEPGAAPPPLPGTPEERAALREKIAAVRVPRAPRASSRSDAVEDFEDLDALPADGEVVQRSTTSDAGAAEERRIDRELEELI